MADQYDVIVIGSGPGGYVTAIRAAQLGLKTAVVEKSYLGGICLNWGCIPTKALLRSAEIFHYMEHAKDYGLSAKEVSFDAAAVVKRSRAVAAQLSNGVGFLMKKNKIDVIWGTATITAARQGHRQGGREPAQGRARRRRLFGQAHHRRHRRAAARAARPGAGQKQVWTYFEAMVPDKMPKSLLVVGSGAIGIEFASFYRTMGAEVTVVEILPQILPVEDEEIAAHARKRFEKAGIKIHTDDQGRQARQGQGFGHRDDRAQGRQERELKVDKVISAVGVVGNIENLGLEKLGVKTDRGCIVIDAYGRTNVQGIYAIGDVAGPPMLAHKAEHEGVICVEAIAGKKPHAMDKLKIPGCTYCNPQIASVGLTEAKAKEAGHDIRVGNFPFIGNGKAIALGEPDGLVKTIFDKKTGQLLGAHMVGAEVTELIQGFVVAMNLETTEEELIETVFPHPTLSEMMHESVLAAYGRVLNI